MFAGHPVSLRARWSGLLIAAAVVLLTGCRTIYTVRIDAINDQTKPLGASYRLEMYDPTGSQEEKVNIMAEQYVRAALGSRGLFEAPSNGKADMIVTAEYGVGPGQMKIVYTAPQGPSLMGPPLTSGSSAKPVLVFEKFLRITARAPVDASASRVPPPASETRGRRTSGNRAPRAARGEELWNVNVSIEDPKKDLAPVLEVLAATAIDHIGGNTGEEVYIRVESGSPEATLKIRK
jgi:hypothetical protein